MDGKEYVVTHTFTNYNENGCIYSKEALDQSLKEYMERCKKGFVGELSHPDRYTFGVDLAEGVDYTSIVVLKRKPKYFEWVTTSTLGDNIKINWQITK